MNNISQLFGNFTFNYMPTKEIFLIFSIIIPAIFLLFTLGHTIYIIGEFKEKNKHIPKLLILVMSKVFIISIILYDILNIQIQSKFDIHVNLLVNTILFFYGLFIIVELLTINLQLNKVTDFNEIQEITDITLKEKFRKINSKNVMLFIAGFTLKIVILILSIIGLFTSIDIFSTLLTILFVFYIYMKIEFLKYVKS